MKISKKPQLLCIFYLQVSQNDNLPKKICDACLYKLDLLYQFWNTTVNAEKQLLQWLGEIGVDLNTKNTNSTALVTHSMNTEIILKEERHELPETNDTSPSYGQQYRFSKTFGQPSSSQCVDVSTTQATSTATTVRIFERKRHSF